MRGPQSTLNSAGGGPPLRRSTLAIAGHMGSRNTQSKRGSNTRSRNKTYASSTTHSNSRNRSSSMCSSS